MLTDRKCIYIYIYYCIYKHFVYIYIYYFHIYTLKYDIYITNHQLDLRLGYQTGCPHAVPFHAPEFSTYPETCTRCISSLAIAIDYPHQPVVPWHRWRFFLPRIPNWVPHSSAYPMTLPRLCSSCGMNSAIAMERPNPGYSGRCYPSLGIGISYTLEKEPIIFRSENSPFEGLCQHPGE